MVNEFCGFKHGVIGTDKIPADTTLNNMKKADLIKLLHTAQHNYESLMWFYNNAVKANMSQLNNNGWIPCSERLPELTEGTECFKQSKCCLVTLRWWDGCMTESIGWYNQSGVWNEDSKNCKVIAWMPLPPKYQQKGE